MAVPLQMVHEVDPREALMKVLWPTASKMKVMSARVLVAVYQRPDTKTKGGIILTSKTRDEDKYQGKVGLVLGLGPLAFKDDATHSWPVSPKVGDWVLYNVGDTLGMDCVSDQRCRFVEDANIFAVVDDPDLVW